MHKLQRYIPSDEPHRLVLSNMQYGLLKEFYNGGQRFTVKRDEALRLDQRSFGPAVARGLLAFDGAVWYMTEAGREFMKAYESRTPWKEYASRGFSHYVEIMRMVHKRRGGRSGGGDRQSKWIRRTA